MNIVNKWIHDGGDHKTKKQRRYIIAGVCLGAAVLCTLAAPIGLVGTVIFGVIGAVKIKNALTDKS